MNACASLLGEPIYQLHSSSVFKPSSYKPVTVHIKKAETVWLSQYVNNLCFNCFYGTGFYGCRYAACQRKT